MRTAQQFIVMSVILLIGTAVARAGSDACRTTTKAAAKACVTEAKADYQLALGKCANESDPAARAACEAAAKAELKDAIEECREQADAREAACSRLGPAPYDPVIDPANFGGPVNNPLLPFIPGMTYVYVGGTESNVVTVTTNTVVILGVTCVEVHDRVFDNGELIEDTLDWFAQDTAGNVWYFGENTHELEDGLIVSLHGQWKAGEDGARPGIVMKASPQMGDFYRQEFLLGTAEDLAEVTGLNETVDVPAGHFVSCLKFRETTPIEPDAAEDKYYAPGIGLVLETDAAGVPGLQLVQVIGP